MILHSDVVVAFPPRLGSHERKGPIPMGDAPVGTNPRFPTKRERSRRFSGMSLKSVISPGVGALESRWDATPPYVVGVDLIQRGDNR
jgi:hypothetical protein